MTLRIDDEWDDDVEDWSPDGDDLDLDECPHCGAEIPADTPHCPYCDRYLSREDAPSRPKPVWIIVGAGLCLAVALMWALGH